jgi:hypothetical protein
MCLIFSEWTKDIFCLKMKNEENIFHISEEKNLKKMQVNKFDVYFETESSDATKLC